MNTKKYFKTITIVLLLATGKQTYAQTDTITLDRAIGAAMQNNRMLNIKKMQV